MGEIQNEIIDEAKKLTIEVYKDSLQPATQEVGKVSGRAAKALLSPIRGFLWGWEKIEKVVIDGVNNRLEEIPDENKKEPDPEIAVPLMQALTYTAQNDTLRELYLNLLSNSMDRSREKDVHPSFVEIIKQINSLDAKVFDRLSKEPGYQKIINPKIQIDGTSSQYISATPQWFLGWVIDDYDIFDISASIIRLSKFGLIDLLYDRTAGKSNIYSELISHDILQEILFKYKKINPEKNLILVKTDSLLHLNEYGKQFKNACI